MPLAHCTKMSRAPPSGEVMFGAPASSVGDSVAPRRQGTGESQPQFMMFFLVWENILSW